MKNVTCDCPTGTTYNTSSGESGDSKFGVCLKQGRSEGSVCYQYQDGPEEYYFWLADGTNGNKWDPHQIHYKGSHQDKMENTIMADAQAKCNIRCANQGNGFARITNQDRSELTDIVNSDGFDPEKLCTKVSLGYYNNGIDRSVWGDKNRNWYQLNDDLVIENEAPNNTRYACPFVCAQSPN